MTNAQTDARAIARLRETLGGIYPDDFRGDNLAVFLASEIEPHIEDETLDDSGTWKQGAIDACDRILDTIHAHYATALAAKDAELAEVRQQYVDANEARIDAEAQLAEARKALEPFAMVAEHDISEDEADSDPFRPMPKPFNHAPRITVGHIRAARRALASGESR